VVFDQFFEDNIQLASSSIKNHFKFKEKKEKKKRKRKKKKVNLN